MKPLWALLAIAVIVTPATADWRDDLWWADRAVNADGHMGRPHYNSYSQRRAYLEQRHRIWRAYRAPQVASYIHREPEYRAEHRHEHRDDPAGHRKCRVEFQAAGDQALTEDGAKQAALKAFQQEIRFAHGELWADPDHAQDKSFLCVKSSVGAGLFHRCRVRARPCIPEGTAQ